MASIVKRGIEQYQAQIRTKGYPSQSRTFSTKKEASAWAAIIESEQARGVFVDRTEAERMTLSEALDRYEIEFTNGKRSAVSERSKIRTIKKHPLALRSLASLCSADFAKYRDERLVSVKPNSVRLELALLSNLFTVIKQEWSIPIDNPIQHIKKPKLPKGRDRRLECDEESRLLNAANQSPTAPYLSACIRFAVETGVRAGELLNLEWVDVDLLRGGINVSHSKNGKPRFVPMSHKAEAILRSLPRDLSGRVINAFGGDVCALARAFKRACNRAGIEGLHFHDLRHEAASRIAPHVSVQTLSKILGWETLQMAMRYYNPTPCELVVAFRASMKAA